MYGKDGKLIKSPTNTKAQDPMLHLGNMLFGGGIEADEERGQHELLESEVLPSDLNYSERSDFEALGFIFGDVVENDPIFRVVTIPEGWTRVGSDHSMWSYIEDERGIRRVSIFYKAAFYDRNAHMSLDNVGISSGMDYI